MAAKAFLKTFWSTLGIVLLFTALLFALTGYVMAGVSSGRPKNYAESRTGRMENGQIRYVKNELYYIAPEAIGLSADALPDGTRICLYFDENGHVIAGENADDRSRETERRVILVGIVVGAMAITLLVFSIVAGKTFGKPWIRWLKSIGDAGSVLLLPPA